MAAPSRAASSVVVNPPFRAEIVGSFLRPVKLKAARETFLGAQTPDQNLGPHDNPDLRKAEDACIRGVIAMQERVGLKVATDGEFRRRNWSMDLLLNWEGLKASRTGNVDLHWKGRGRKDEQSSIFLIASPIRWRPSPLVRAFEFLKANTTAMPKVTMPGPGLVHHTAGGDNGIRASLYGDRKSVV